MKKRDGVAGGQRGGDGHAAAAYQDAAGTATAVGQPKAAAAGESMVTARLLGIVSIIGSFMACCYHWLGRWRVMVEIMVVE